MDRKKLPGNERFKRLTLDFLREAPNNSCDKKVLYSKIARHLEVKVNKELMTKVNRAIGSLKRKDPPKVRETGLINPRIKRLY